MDFVEICKVYIGKMIIKAVKKIFNSDTICRSYSDLNFGVTFFGTQCSIGLLSVLLISFKVYVFKISDKIDRRVLNCDILFSGTLFMRTHCTDTY